MESTPIYNLRPAEVYAALETNPQGLTSEEAEARRSLYGANLLSEHPRTPLVQRFLVHAGHPLGLLLWVAGLLAFLVGELVLGLVIWALVLINSALSFWREHRAEEAMDALSRMLPSFARVLRNGEEVHLPSSNVMPGDVLVLAEGDNIPADARVVEEYGLRTNNATLTGEAVPARKTADASLRPEIGEVERPNLVFAGTSVVSGTGKAVVYATGMLTQFGRIAHLTQAVRETPSRLQLEMLRLTRRIWWGALALGGIIFFVALTDVGLGIVEAFVLSLGIIVAAVPEGLPATITLSLARAAQRLAQRGVLVKKLAVIETLGTISMICTDKSGTLTQNQMTVREVWAGGKRYSVSGVGYDPKGEFRLRRTSRRKEGPGQTAGRDLEALLSAASLCNNSRLNPPTQEHPQWSALGDQTEAALHVAAIKGGLDEEKLSENSQRVHELPFDARRKRMSTIHQNAQAGPGKRQVAFVKGAPREVLQLCTQILIDGETHPLDENWRAEVLAINDDYARRALRVLALARRELLPRTGAYSVDKVERDLTFLGLAAMMDPPRPEVSEAVQVCRQAGIRMVMITGDYGLTAESLARRVGMLVSDRPQIVTGAELDEMNDAQLQATLDQETIFARMAPEHKLRLVAAYQERGEVVAVTGDGVNDAPALRKADVGVVMGLVGTDVAKEAADIILTNDNFSSITTAIEEGRAVYDNIRKFITYIFSSNVPETLPFILTAMFAGLPLALTPRQILAIDLGTDLFPALALGTEKPEPNVMKRPPLRRSQPLVDRSLLLRSFLWLGLIEAALCFTGFFWVWGNYGASQNWLPLAVTTYHAGVVMAQVGNVFACRSPRTRGRHLGWFSNPSLLWGVAFEIGLILALIYIPGLNTAFQHVPLPLTFWGGLLLYPFILYGLEWIRKSLVRALEARQASAQVYAAITSQATDLEPPEPVDELGRDPVRK